MDRVASPERERPILVRVEGRLTALLPIRVSRSTMMGKEVFDLVRFIVEKRDLLRHALPETIQLIVEAASGPCPVEADPGRLDQVLVSLVHQHRASHSQVRTWLSGELSQFQPILCLWVERHSAFGLHPILRALVEARVPRSVTSAIRKTIAGKYDRRCHQQAPTAGIQAASHR